jgi:hypothetical protein
LLQRALRAVLATDTAADAKKKYFCNTKHAEIKGYKYLSKAVLKFGSEAWVLKKKEEQRLEATQMKFLKHLLGISKLDKGKNQCIREIQ